MSTHPVEPAARTYFWHYAGMIERGGGRRSSSPGYTNKLGYSCLSGDGGSTQPWRTRREAASDSKGWDGKAIFFATRAEALAAMRAERSDQLEGQSDG